MLSMSASRRISWLCKMRRFFDGNNGAHGDDRVVLLLVSFCKRTACHEAVASDHSRCCSDPLLRYFLVLDEAQNIKNFQSKRWQTLLHFNTKRRLLLTGTPLQNSLMELWSLMHFLMPSIFRSRGEFKYVDVCTSRPNTAEEEMFKF